MKIDEQIKFHFESRKYCQIKRQVDETSIKINCGYIVDYSKDFIILQESDDFKILGYLIFPVATLKKIRFNNNDKYYDKIIRKEGLIELVQKKHPIDLTNWATIFKTIKSTGFNVIVENENPKDESFDIGPIIKITQSVVYVQYFNAQGYLDHKPTKIKFDKITIAKFDDNYINVFSKYLRRGKPK